MSYAPAGSGGVNALLFGTDWNAGAGGAAITALSYSFAGPGSLWDASYNYGIGSEPGTGFAPLSGIGQQAVRNAFLSWSSVANLEFQEVADDASGYGILRLGYTTLGMDASQLGYAYAPADSANGGDVWLNAQLKDSLYASFTPGSLSSYVVLHELGHTLGLKHPHAQSPANSVTLGSLEDSLFNSVMSYYAWPGVALTQTNIDRLPTTPMQLDIDALQTLYGANTSSRSGDDVYSYDGDGKYLETIFDTGGNDTIEVTGSRAAEIDLRPGEWSQLGVPVQINGGSIQSADTVRIYHDTLIENAIGGDGNDYLIGNDLANQLIGNGGNDTLEGGAGKDTLTGGIGADTYILSASVEDTLADFSLAQGDKLDVGHVTQDLVGYTSGENPFAGGFLRLSQIGTDALLRYDQDGAGSAYASQALARLLNTDAAALDQSSLVQGYDPHATPQYAAGFTLIGSAGDDNFYGGADDDVLSGLGGNDALRGGGGNDYLDGGEGADIIYGDTGDDNLLGGAGNDTLSGNPGADSVDGGPGNDTIYAYMGEGNDTLLGGTGDDYFQVGDYSSGFSTVATTITVDGGDGADRFVCYSYPTIVATGGAGVDTYELMTFKLVITDFATGAGGDLIDCGGFGGYSGGNPFDPSQGYLRLIQNGADAELQLDPDGAAGIASGLTAIVFQNLDKNAITADNFVGGFAPDGSVAPGIALTGTSGNDSLLGTYSDDTISGFGGNDTIRGSGGSDYIDGGDGDDEVHGGPGNDTILGGLGSDLLYADNGDNHVDGGSGNDSIWAYGSTGSDTLAGGAGDDVFFVKSPSSSGLRTVAIDGGDGADRINFYAYPWQDSTHPSSIIATGGAGVDTYYSIDGSAYGLAITDFAPGAGGDLIDVTKLLDYSAAAGRGYTGGNPFDPSQGYLRLIQNGADAELQYDPDGAAGTASTLRSAIVFQNLDKNAITADNFVGGIPPDGSLVAGVVLTGTSGNDSLPGSYFDDTISGLGGADTIRGSGGSDYLDAGDDADEVRGGAGNDTLLGGAGDDILWGDEGDDFIEGGIGNDTIYDWIGAAGSHNTLLGGPGDDGFQVSAFTPAGSNGQAAVVTVDGGDGGDFIFFSGNSLDTTVAAVVATGGAGVDSYWFNYGPSSSGLVITDFATGAGGDLIDAKRLLDWSAVSGRGYTGGNPFNSSLGYLRLIQNGANAELQYDEDGVSGTGTAFGTAITFQNLDKDTITSANFVGKFILGTEGNDDLKGEWTNDTLQGLGGDDSLDGGEGSDIMEGGGGEDVYRVDSLGDIVSEVAGAGNADKVQAAIEDYHLADEVEDLDLEVGIARGHGNDKANHLKGNGGDNILDGGHGADRMEGGQGADTYYVDDPGDDVHEADNTPSGSAGLKLGLDLGSIIDTVVASVSYTLTNYVERLTLATGTAALTATGNTLDNLLTGNAGDNILSGGVGNDTIDGGTATDTATFSGNRSAYSLAPIADGYTITDTNVADGDEGTDTLIGIERLVFADIGVNLVMNVNFLAYDWKSHSLLGGVDISGTDHGGTTDGSGGASFTAVTGALLPLAVTRAVAVDEADLTSAAVNLQDAIAILKLIVGLEANGAGRALSPYQALAADYDGNGQVQLTDAIGVLKHVVGLAAPAPAWHFASETDAAIPQVAALSPGAAPAISIDLSTAATPAHVGLVAYLSGDVDGSFAGVSGAQVLDVAQSGYFEQLANATGLNLSQFGIYG